MKMNLTSIELQVMSVLWRHKNPMTAMEIFKASTNPTWKKSSIFGIMKTLQEKGAVVFVQNKPTVTTHVRTYKMAITLEKYAVMLLQRLDMDIKQAGDADICIDYDVVGESIKQMKEGK